MEVTHESSKDLFSFTVGSRTAVFGMTKIIRIFVALTIISFYLNLVLGCAYVFTCSSFTPSPHYLGSFLGYNRFYVMSFGLLTITAGLMYLGICIEFCSKSSLLENIALKGVGIFTCIALPIISLTNEVNSTHFVNFTEIYTALSYCVLIFNVIWLLVLYRKVRKNSFSVWRIRISIIYFIFTAACYVIVSIQRKQNYKTENWFINTTYWSVSEWILITLEIGSIAVVSSINQTFKITLGPTKEEQVEDQIELGKI